MKMWQPDSFLAGPVPATEADVAALNRLFSDSFTDRYRRDGLVGVRVPRLNPEIWSYAIRDAGEGAMLWRDEDEELVAFNIAHHSGVEGWMGPLAVRADRQNLGLGKAIVSTAVDWLREQGVTTLGLETMPRTVDNIGFYSRLGFVPQYLTMTMTGEARGHTVRGPFVCLSELSPSERPSMLARCRERLHASVSDVDFSRECALTESLGIGDTVIVERGGDVAGFSLWHSAPLAQNRPTDEMRVLKLFAESLETFEKLIVATERCATRIRIPRVAIRCQTAYGAAFRSLVDAGYRVRWTDLRMTLEGLGERMLPKGEILFSNWEI